ncbi:hypothetical protein DFQ05_0457 [Winogradskyella wandonensis]|uniref:Uncharacterized protein n=1 Tax=Winogradskyella wandonensis TaxID=1442586 RepID=A0A4R1KW45_9FLAO|nr:hypothetical protein [Winogradskyella wandonensis]TCK68947.1 hypothetical protein DFQ05_0457 [Winogradskyella wandonensis]
MKFRLPFPLNYNTVSLCIIAIVALTFITAGIFDVLDYVIFKILLIGLTAALAIIVSVILFKKDIKKNRLTTNLKDDSH